jgi:protein-tyrosine kinase
LEDTVSRTFDALIKAETASTQKRRGAEKKRAVNFSPLSVFKGKRRPIKIDFDLDPYIEEQYHRLRLHLLPNPKRAAIKVVMVAATDHGEGGTTTAAILASTLARSGNSKILLVDANLRTPALEDIFDQGQGYKLVGLSDKILSETPLEQTIYETDIPNLFFMPCGRAVTSPSYVFDSEPLGQMLSALREQFDFVIFDGSPLRDYSESSFLAEKMDGVILVVEAERTKTEVVQKIRKELESAGVSILGVVLNKKRNYIPAYLESFL